MEYEEHGDIYDYMDFDEDYQLKWEYLGEPPPFCTGAKQCVNGGSIEKRGLLPHWAKVLLQPQKTVGTMEVDLPITHCQVVMWVRNPGAV